MVYSTLVEFFVSSSSFHIMLFICSFRFISISVSFNTICHMLIDWILLLNYRHCAFMSNAGHVMVIKRWKQMNKRKKKNHKKIYKIYHLGLSIYPSMACVCMCAIIFHFIWWSYYWTGIFSHFYPFNSYKIL